MPAIVGVVRVITVSSSSIFNIGDVYTIMPQSQSKTYAGGGSFNTGDGITNYLNQSNTQVKDPDVVDQPMASVR